MRFSNFSFLFYSLSLVAVTAGQSGFVSDVGNLLDGSSASASATETAAETSTSASESSSPTPTESSATPTTDSSTSSDSPTSTDSTTTDSSTASSSQDATTTTDPSSTASTTSEPTTTTPHTITTIQTISGTPLPTTMTSEEASQSTNPPSLSTTDKDSNSGLSSHDKQVIIGVVVGVGGALIIGAIGVVIWRMRSRKGSRSDADEAADLMSGTAVGTGNREKAPSPGAGHGNTPFQSTLDQYHNPGPVNAASNF